MGFQYLEGERVGIPIPHPVTRKQVRAEINRRGLAAVMNNTKWSELVEAVTTELPFRPAYQLKLLLMDRPIPPDFSTDDPWFAGAWTREALWPYVEIEWIRILPRILRAEGCCCHLRSKA